METRPGRPYIIDSAFRFVFPLISLFAFGYSIQVPHVKINWITLPTCMVMLNTVQPWHENMDQAQDAPHNIGGEVLVMPEYQHVQDPIKEAHPSWYNGTFDAPHLMK